MKNLDQIRAENALKAAQQKGASIAGKQDGEVIKKIPALILNHGLLATAAYGFSDQGFRAAFDAIAEHLADSRIGMLPENTSTLDGLVTHLTRPDSTSEELRLATAETMAWLNFARRFIKPKKKEGDS
ncbi:MAG: hypothetical protein EA425_13230 [Puniceicoccaceae bacterium]|nr:MAG: hypothetical protein EA425_13230 [Puniceicoccaceae bacterium]